MFSFASPGISPSFASPGLASPCLAIGSPAFGSPAIGSPFLGSPFLRLVGGRLGLVLLQARLRRLHVLGALGHLLAGLGGGVLQVLGQLIRLGRQLTLVLRQVRVVVLLGAGVRGLGGILRLLLDAL